MPPDPRYPSLFNLTEREARLLLAAYFCEREKPSPSRIDFARVAAMDGSRSKESALRRYHIYVARHRLWGHGGDADDGVAAVTTSTAVVAAAAAPPGGGIGAVVTDAAALAAAGILTPATAGNLPGVGFAVGAATTTTVAVAGSGAVIAPTAASAPATTGSRVPAAGVVFSGAGAAVGVAAAATPAVTASSGGSFMTRERKPLPTLESRDQKRKAAADEALKLQSEFSRPFKRGTPFRNGPKPDDDKDQVEAGPSCEKGKGNDVNNPIKLEDAESEDDEA